MNRMTKINADIRRFYWKIRDDNWTNEDGSYSVSYELGNEPVMIVVYKHGEEPVRHVYTNDRRKIAAAIMKWFISIWPRCGVTPLECYRWSKKWKNKSA